MSIIDDFFSKLFGEKDKPSLPYYNLNDSGMTLSKPDSAPIRRTVKFTKTEILHYANGSRTFETQTANIEESYLPSSPYRKIDLAKANEFCDIYGNKAIEKWEAQFNDSYSPSLPYYKP